MKQYQTLALRRWATHCTTTGSLLLFALAGWAQAQPEAAGLRELLQPSLAGHSEQTGLYVLEKGEEALLARAWLADHAAERIDVQYFIWSSDNIGILASEALLRAAERGVQVRVLVDDLLIDAPPETMLALAQHPCIKIRIYNPKLNVGTSTAKRLSNIATGLRAVNQRMHDKTALFDGLVGITGGRNMADEYFDYDHSYNFRDRDVLVVGLEVKEMEASFERFWEGPLAVPVETLLTKELARMTPERSRRVCDRLHAYAASPENFAPEVRQALQDQTRNYERISRAMVWDTAYFLSDLPGKNSGGYDGGGRTTTALVTALLKARSTVTIQSPYLIMPEGALALFTELVKRGVKVRIVTNSLASTDNLQAFSGYSKQRKKILQGGITVFEFKPDPAVKRELIERYAKLEKLAPIFAIHAKSMVIDGLTLFVGTFNFDPRSANLNTEVGILVDNPLLAQQVERAIEQDMAPENSWNAADKPDRFAPADKRLKVRNWKLLPMEPFL